MCPFSSRNGAQEFSEAEIAIHLDLEDITVPFHWDSRRILYAIGNYQVANAKCQTQRRLLRLEDHFTEKVEVPLFHILIAIHPWSFNIQ